MSNTFDFDKALKELQAGKDLTGKDGMGSKTIKTGSGSVELNAPRAGTFELQLIKKSRTQLTPEIDRKILSLFSHGMNYRDIKCHTQDMYGIEVATGSITAITDQLIPDLKHAQRSLNSVYPIVWITGEKRVEK